MANGRGDELQALRRVIQICRAQAIDLDMPALNHILGRAEVSLASHQAAPPQLLQRRDATSLARERVTRH